MSENLRTFTFTPAQCYLLASACESSASDLKALTNEDARFGQWAEMLQFMQAQLAVDTKEARAELLKGGAQ